MLTQEMSTSYAKRLRSRGWQVTENDCWEIRGAHTGSGYVQLNVPGERKSYMSAHRMAYLAWVGDIPERHVVRHLVCDNKRCINPVHLAIGTQQDNVDDKVRKGRQAHGSTHGRAIISEDVARQIVHLRNANYRQEDVSRIFGIGVGTVKAVFSGRLWHEATKDMPRERRNYRTGALLRVDYV